MNALFGGVAHGTTKQLEELHDALQYGLAVDSNFEHGLPFPAQVDEADRKIEVHVSAFGGQRHKGNETAPGQQDSRPESDLAILEPVPKPARRRQAPRAGVHTASIGCTLLTDQPKTELLGAFRRALVDFSHWYVVRVAAPV